MSIFSDMKIGTKLIGSFTALLGIMAFLGVFALSQMNRMNDASTEITTNWLPAVKVISEINTNTSDFRIAEMSHVLSTENKVMEKYEKDISSLAVTIDKNIKTFEKLISSPEEQRLYEEFMQKWNLYLAEHQKLLTLSRANKTEDANALMKGASERLFNDMSAQLLKLVSLNEEGGAVASEHSDQIFASSQVSVLVILAIAITIGLILALTVTRNLLAQLGGEPKYAAEIMQKIAHGDLSNNISVNSKYTDSMLYAMKEMQESLIKIVSEVRHSTNSIGTASEEIAHGTTDLSQRTEEQASSLEETASSMEELTSTVKQNADNARQANQLAAGASEVAMKGGAVVGQVVQTMSSINDSSKKIVDIISVIDGIAFQTNILALNAAVEAARAGEQGRGFAVVATEVRTLAQRSATAAKEIKELISDSVAKVEDGSRLVDEAGVTMDEIVTAVKRVTDIMSEIAAASHEQSSGIEQVNQAVTQMDEVTQQNAALVEEAAAATESMKEQALVLTQAVSAFKLSHEGSSAPATVKRNNRPAPAKIPKRGAVTRKIVVKPKVEAAPATMLPAQPRKVAAGGGGDEWEEF